VRDATFSSSDRYHFTLRDEVSPASTGACNVDRDIRHSAISGNLPQRGSICVGDHLIGGISVGPFDDDRVLPLMAEFLAEFLNAIVAVTTLIPKYLFACRSGELKGAHLP
jgi:hypothetical protein